MTLDGTDAVSATYDAENRIASATKSGVTTSYVYDADGNRVEKRTPPPPATPTDGTLYWYMTPGIVAESDLTGALKSEYVFFNGERRVPQASAPVLLSLTTNIGALPFPQKLRAFCSFEERVGLEYRRAERVATHLWRW